MNRASDVRIAGIEKCSFVDYPGRMAAVFFTPGCNWNCFYCHNRPLIGGAPAPRFDAETALAWLDARRGFLDAVVISGGEPTLQLGLADFIRRIRDKGYLVKLDTNGSQPKVLAALLDECLPDYVAMDLKAPLDKYESVCGVPIDHRALNASIDLLLSGLMDYEFRTTAVPQLTPADIVAIARRIRGARRYVLQQYRRPRIAASFLPHDPRLDFAPHPPSWPAALLDELRPIVQRCETRGFDVEERAAIDTAA